MTISQTPTWHPNPSVSYDCDILADDAMAARGVCLGKVEDFGYACYPTAVNAKTGNAERGGPHEDRIEARLWVERVAGLHPAVPGDEREPFYYHPDGDAE